MRKLLAFFALVTALLSAEAQPRPHMDPNYPDVHDPVMAKGENGRYYIFSTGMGIGVMSSADLKEWRPEPGVFAMDAIPQWAKDTVPGYHGHTWAPDIVRHNDRWYVYYSCSTFGKNGSAIGVATTKTLDRESADFGWTDLGPVVVSHPKKDNWNAIDPNIVITPEGKPWMVYGSFWDGLQLMPLADDMKTPLAAPRTVARRFDKHVDLDKIQFTVEGKDTIKAGDNAIEGPFIIKHDGWYYLLVSWDYCCRGAKSTYKTVYGRSRNVEGPYYDLSGVDMAKGGGTFLVGPDERYFGVGHCSAYELDGQWWFLCHAYDAQVNARAKIYLRKMTFDGNGFIRLEE